MDDPAGPEAMCAFEAFAVDGEGIAPCTRFAIAEEPLRIVVNGEPAATLMRTPGGEIELALGFLLSEGLTASLAEVASVTFCRDGRSGTAGEVCVQLTGDMRRPIQPRYREVFSSCSLCGLELIEAYANDLQPFTRPPGRLSLADATALRDAMFGTQDLFHRTGGTHAAAVGELPIDAARAVVREDIGRHNALDKAIGGAAGLALQRDRSLVVLSGRVSFEMVAKTARAGYCDLVGVGAPSALGIGLARRLRMFLGGFLRGSAMTVYSGIEALR